MALAVDFTGVAVGGAGVVVAVVDLAGATSARVILKNSGAQPLGAGVKVQGAKSVGSSDWADLDASTFSALAAGAVKQAVITGPIDAIRVLADWNGNSTTVDVSVSTSPDR